MKKILMLSVVALALSSCGQRGAPPAPKAHGALSNTEVARIAATCLHWPREVVAKIQVRDIIMPAREHAPYLNFPNGRTVPVSATGTCNTVIPTQVISLTPMHHMGQADIIATDTSVHSHLWIVMVSDPHADGTRAVLALEGKPSVNMPSSRPVLPVPLKPKAPAVVGNTIAT